MRDYLKHYVGLLLFAIIYTAIAIGLMFVNSALVVFLAIGIVLLVYSLLSVVILAREVRRQLKEQSENGFVCCD